MAVRTHPAPSGGVVRSAAREWRLPASPARVWALFSDLAALGEALGAPRMRPVKAAFDDSLARLMESAGSGGRGAARWREKPCEWVQGLWWRAERFYDSGPFARTQAALHVQPDGEDGTRLVYSVEAEAVGVIGKAMLSAGYLEQAVSAFDRQARAAEAHLRDPARPPFLLKGGAKPPPEAKVSELAARLRAAQIPRAEAEGFALFLLSAPESAILPLRPAALARALGAEDAKALAWCLAAARGGALDLAWRRICPACGVRAGRHARLEEALFAPPCPVCGCEEPGALDETVEPMFTPRLEGRPLAIGRFAAESPSDSPHVAVRQCLAAGERREFPAMVPPGLYRLRDHLGRKGDPFALGSGQPTPICMASDDLPRCGRAAPDGSLVFENRSQRRIVLNLERVDEGAALRLRPSALLMNHDFRRFWPAMQLGRASPARVEAAAALALRPTGPEVALDVEPLAELARLCKGALTEAAEDGALFVFADPADALGAAIWLLDLAPDPESGRRPDVADLAVGLHMGPMQAEDGPEGGVVFRGETILRAAALCALARPGEAGVSAELLTHPSAQTRLTSVAAQADEGPVGPAREIQPFWRLGAV
ncbi:DUF5939 domain-containing protein [Neomegalonema sp.]|uniref:DUF5939 domain-containing protein n=1 Tax=Neomegalonema sp. TaxID=2039713 RepID=UPI002618DBA7|nr:DUF5939 domain-containing protein [Neomegalonema sp.]MDD2869837.1 DUF5939 domain-containing protein [Neomegalonema sp.]